MSLLGLLILKYSTVSYRRYKVKVFLSFFLNFYNGIQKCGHLKKDMLNKFKHILTFCNCFDKTYSKQNKLPTSSNIYFCPLTIFRAVLISCKDKSDNNQTLLTLKLPGGAKWPYL